MNTDKMMSVLTVAKRLNCSRSFVYQLVNLGELKAIKTGARKGIRVSESSYRKYVKSCAIDADPASAGGRVS